jgi:hypothetical protein
MDRYMSTRYVRKANNTIEDISFLALRLFVLLGLFKMNDKTLI